MLPLVSSQRGKVCVLCINGDDRSAMRGILLGKAIPYHEQALDPSPATSTLGSLTTLMLLLTSASGVASSSCYSLVQMALVDSSVLMTHVTSLPITTSTSFERYILLCPPLCYLMGPCTECSKATTMAEGSQRAMEAMERVMKGAFEDRLTLRNTMKPVLIPSKSSSRSSSHLPMH